MEPSKVSSELRRIATAINSSQNPSIELVARDIGLLIKKVAGSDDELLRRAAPVALAGEMKDLVEKYAMRNGLKEEDFRKALEIVISEVFI
jgi:hypothetical protein